MGFDGQDLTARGPSCTVGAQLDIANSGRGKEKKKDLSPWTLGCLYHTLSPMEVRHTSSRMEPDPVIRYIGDQGWNLILSIATRGCEI